MSGALVESPTFYKFMSARENLRIFSRLSGGCSEKRVDQVLDMVGLLDRANDKVKCYSHGMRQRLGIAQALLPGPRLVILDEPTSGLDPQGMRDVRDLIRRLAKEEQVTIFLSSHLLHEVEQVCNRVGIINHGRLIAEGSVSELLQTEIEIVEFGVENTDRALDVLRQIDWVEILPSEAGSIVVRVAPRLVPEVNRALVAADVNVHAIMPRSASLEDLFLELVEEGQDAG
jgi:ABC-type multidrug transport system ATPase subunit